MNSRNLIIASTALLALQGCTARQEKKPNVLFICIDDLRRELGCMDSPVLTPNIDRLASEGTLFTHQYVSAPTSGASRYGIFTGLLPRSGKDIGNNASVFNLSDRPEGPAPETMFHQLRRNGYHTVGIGKISHSADGRVYGYNEAQSDKLEFPYSWDEMLFNPGKWKNGWNAFFGYPDGTNRQMMNRQVKPYECAEVGDNELPDGLTAELAVQKLKELSQSDQPFCLAVGFFKPHLPFVSPKKYWDLYDEDQIALSPVPDVPEWMPRASLQNSGEFNGGYRLGEETLDLKHRASDAYARKLRHAYFACVSYTDALVGQVLSALDDCGLSDNTIVVLWGDHGWHLGDFQVWGKHTLCETALGSPLIVRAPGFARGVKNHRIVSSMDVYPTLMDLCGVPEPEGLSGSSFKCLLENPDAQWTDRAYSFFNHGISVRVPEGRLTYYRRKGVESLELYRYDEDQMEKENLIEKEPELAGQIWNHFLESEVRHYDKIYGKK